MGSICSRPKITHDVLNMPLYFDAKDATKTDLAVVKNCWNILESNLCPTFLEQQLSMSKDQCPFSNSLSWYYHIYYNRVIVSYPAFVRKFTDAAAVESFLSRLIRILLIPLTSKIHFREKAKSLAASSGLRAVEYGFIGSTMFWSLKSCLAELFSDAMHDAWVRVYCRLLRVVVPIAVAYESSGAFDLNSGRLSNAIRTNPSSNSEAPAPKSEGRDPEQNKEIHFSTIQVVKPAKSGKADQSSNLTDGLFTRVRQFTSKVSPHNDNDLVEEDVKSISIDTSHHQQRHVSLRSRGSSSHISEKSRSYLASN